jgi:hypothetical protein
MAFVREPGKYYRMPVFFGPLPGPRWWPEGVTSDFEKTPTRDVVGVRYLTDKAKLEACLPEGFSVWGEPVLTVEITYMNELAWLAGGGYNMGDVKFQAVYQSKDGPIHGTMVMVRWEDLADPILSGREELGHNKLFCDIPPLQGNAGRFHTRLAWRNFQFLKIELSNLEDAPVPAPNPQHKGLLSYKYVPATGGWGEATPDAAYATLTPPAWGGKTLKFQKGEGKIEWARPSFEDLPTQYTIVNGFAAFPILEWRGAYRMQMEGGASGSETHRVD